MDTNSTLSVNDAEWLEATFARNRALFNGFKMELDEGGDESNDESTDESSETDEVEQEGAEESEDSDESDEGDDEGDTLSREDALKALTKARKDAGKYRTKLREVESRFKDAKTPEEFQAALDALKSDNEAESLALIRENVQLRYNLPDDVAATLSGNTKDELEAQAKVLARYIVSNEGDPEYQGGLEPDSSTTDGEDVAATVARVRRNRY